VSTKGQVIFLTGIIVVMMVIARFAP